MNREMAKMYASCLWVVLKILFLEFCYSEM